MSACCVILAVIASGEEVARLHVPGMPFDERLPSTHRTRQQAAFTPTGADCLCACLEDLRHELCANAPRAASAPFFAAIPLSDDDTEMAFWRAMIPPDGVELADLVPPASGAPLPPAFNTIPLLRAVAAQGTNAVPLSAAELLGLASLPVVARRRERQGVTILLAQENRVRAFLVCGSRLWGVCLLPSAVFHAVFASRPNLLAEFRLGWLPNETARAAGGAGAHLACLPAEAEGFCPTFVYGGDAHFPKNLGQPLPQLPCTTDLALRGLAFALEEANES